jgi:hypothetical protein
MESPTIAMRTLTVAPNTRRAMAQLTPRSARMTPQLGAASTTVLWAEASVQLQKKVKGEKKVKVKVKGVSLSLSLE